MVAAWKTKCGTAKTSQATSEARTSSFPKETAANANSTPRARYIAPTSASRCPL